MGPNYHGKIFYICNFVEIPIGILKFKALRDYINPTTSWNINLWELSKNRVLHNNLIGMEQSSKPEAGSYIIVCSVLPILLCTTIMFLSDCSAVALQPTAMIKPAYESPPSSTLILAVTPTPAITSINLTGKVTSTIAAKPTLQVTLTLTEAQITTAISTGSPYTSSVWVTYTIVAGDTLSVIALRYGTSISALKEANDLDSNTIYVDQVLMIPHAGATPTSESMTSVGRDRDVMTTPSRVPLHVTPIHPAILKGDLAAAYPAELRTERFTLHYTPGTLAAQYPQALANIIADTLAHHERLLAVSLSGRFDAYAASMLFPAPDQALRGRSFSAQRRFFFLDDGAGTSTDQQYIIAHEFTHVFTWNAFGAPSSVMLHEGIAVYSGMDFIAGREFLPINQFCAAYLQAGVLPRVSNNLRFMGHIYDLENYYTAGCFVGFLIEHYGPEKFGQLYQTGNYAAIYGKTLLNLEVEWMGELATSEIRFTFTPVDLVKAVNAVKKAYNNLFRDFSYTADQMTGYIQLDAIRINLLEGHIDAVRQHFGF